MIYTMFGEIQQLYLSGTFCDLKLYAGSVGHVECHALVVCSALPYLEALLKFAELSEDGMHHVVLPVNHIKTIRNTLKDIYRTLALDKTKRPPKQKWHKDLGLLQTKAVLVHQQNGYSANKKYMTVIRLRNSPPQVETDSKTDIKDVQQDVLDHPMDEMQNDDNDDGFPHTDIVNEEEPNKILTEGKPPKPQKSKNVQNAKNRRRPRTDRSDDDDDDFPHIDIVGKEESPSNDSKAPKPQKSKNVQKGKKRKRPRTDKSDKDDDDVDTNAKSRFRRWKDRKRAEALIEFTDNALNLMAKCGEQALLQATTAKRVCFENLVDSYDEMVALKNDVDIFEIVSVQITPDSSSTAANVCILSCSDKDLMCQTLFSMVQLLILVPISLLMESKSHGLFQEPSQDSIDAEAEEMKGLTLKQWQRAKEAFRVHSYSTSSVPLGGNFQPLPRNPTVLVVDLTVVTHIATKHVSDYAVLYGKSVNELTLRPLVDAQVCRSDPVEWCDFLVAYVANLCGLSSPDKLNELGTFASKLEAHKKLTCTREAMKLVPESIWAKVNTNQVNHTKSPSVKKKRVYEGRPLSTVKCTKCYVDVPRNEMAAHKVSHYNCKCDIQFKTLKARSKHMLAQHSGRKYHHCSSCSYMATTEEKIQKHVDSYHSGNISLVCDECGVTSWNLLSFKNHMYCYHTLKKCKECGMEFSGTLALGKHKRNEHTKTKEKEHMCPICGRKFHEKTYLTRHMKNHASQEEKPYKCEYCGLAFSFPDPLKGHIDSIHLKLRQYACRWNPKLCDRTFLNSQNRRNHELKNHQLDIVTKRGAKPKYFS